MSAGLQRVLVIDDDPDDALLVRRCLERNPLTAGCAVDHALGPERGLQMLASGAYDAGLLDYRLGATDGIAVLGLARARGLATPLVLMTGGGDEQVAVEAMKAGAVDYMAKSRMTPDSLAAALRYAASLGESRRRLAETERRFRRVFDQAIVGNVISTPAGRLLACNQALASMLGYATVAELQEVNAYDLYADRRRRDEYLDHLRAHGFVEGFECEFVRADGGRIRVVVHGAAIKDEQGALVETHASVLDVTAHVRAQQALRDSEERYRGLFEGNPLAIVVAEEESLRILAVNEAAVRQYGYSREEFARLVLLDLRPPEDAPAMLERFRATADAAVRFTSGRHVRKDGTVFEVEVEAHPIVFGGRRARAGVVTDVTERHRAERALRASEERFRALVENSSDGVVILDHQGVVRYGSPATARLLGWRPEELLGRSAFDLGYGGDHALMRERVAEATRHPGQPVEATARILCRDGSFRLFDCVVTDRSSEPSVSGLVVNYRDVTDRRRAEDDLRLRDRAIEHISQALVIIDALDTRRPIVHVNRGFERITGYAAAQAIGRNARFLAGPETDPAALDLLSRAIAEGRTGAVDVVIYRRDGAPVWCNVAVTPVAAPDGRITHFVGLGTDITARRRLEEQYRQAQKMEAVGRLAGGIAHDFNNLLSVILGYADVALRRLGPHDATRTKIEEIAKAGHRAAALTRQLLAFGRKQVLNPTPLDLGGVAADIGPMLRRLIGEDVTLCLEVQPDLG
ncbi:MAG TPA: PAS domain S-box protein, partial [Vicinamibacteria bacterium]|nr:PAS domain S-box protein [Vicinamibacteria bacterium]